MLKYYKPIITSNIDPDNIITYGSGNKICSFNTKNNAINTHFINDIMIYNFNIKQYIIHQIEQSVTIKQIMILNNSYIKNTKFLLLLLSNGSVIITCNNIRHKRNILVIKNNNISGIYVFSHDVYIITTDGTLRSINIKKLLNEELKRNNNNELLYDIYMEIYVSYDNIITRDISKLLLSNHINSHILIKKNNNKCITYNLRKNMTKMEVCMCDVIDTYIKKYIQFIDLYLIVFNTDIVVFVSNDFKLSEINKNILMSTNMFIIEKKKIIDVTTHNKNKRLYITYTGNMLYEYIYNYNGGFKISPDMFKLLRKYTNVYMVLYGNIIYYKDLGRSINEYTINNILCIYNIDIFNNVNIIRKKWNHKNHYKFNDKVKLLIKTYIMVLKYYKIEIPICLLKYIINEYILINSDNFG